MKLKRMIAGFLTAAMLCGLLVAVPAGAVSASGGFTDIADAGVAQAAETLRLLGIVSGDGGGAFTPGGYLTRAQFCKMAVMALGKGTEAEAQMNRTIFRDVLGTNWARGYINFAASYPIGGDAEGKGGDMLMAGKGNGCFYPEDTITYAEAVTVMMRILGYSSKELTSGATWYDGALAAAKAVGLTHGLDLAWNASVTRGQTALLFENMLYASPKGGKDSYLVTSLGGKMVKEAVILSLDATTDDGATGAVQITGDIPPYKTDHAPFNSALEGSRAQLVLDKDEKVIAIQPSTVGSRKTVVIVSAEVTYVTEAGGVKLDVPQTTTVYKDGKTLTYKDVYLNIKPSTQAVFHYAANGNLEYIFLPSTDIAETAAVAQATGGNPFSSLVGGDTNYRVVKNGLNASTTDIRQYDVGTYDKATRTLYVSDLRLTGAYENVAPSPATPLSVTVMGVSFPVLPAAYGDFAKFKLGDAITLLLTADCQVAGVVSATEVKSATVGVVTAAKGFTKDGDGKKIPNSGSATVVPLSDLRDAAGEKIALTGSTNLNDYNANLLLGQLVTVSFEQKSRINLTPLSGNGATGSLNVAARTLDGAPLSDNVHLYEQVGNGKLAPITFAQLTRAAIPGSQITYVGRDYAGRVDILIFNDVTGDQYIYGMSELTTVSGNKGVLVKHGGKADPDALILAGKNIGEGLYIGAAASLSLVGSNYRLADWAALKSVTKVARSDFQVDLEPVLDSKGNALPIPIGTVTAGDLVLPIAGNVVCYNEVTKTWFNSLNDARAYSDTLTIYYDSAPQDGGKVRLVVVE